MPNYSSRGSQLVSTHLPNPSCKLRLINAEDPSDNYVALFNPAELEVSLAAKIGMLEPIGWSHHVQQYASTGSAQFPLTLWFSTFAMMGLTTPVAPGFPIGLPNSGSEWMDVRGPVDWLTSFVMADAPGEAPPRLFIHWPNTICMRVCVHNVSFRYTLWDTNSVPRIAEVKMALTEDPGEFVSRQDHLTLGWARRSSSGYKVVR